MSKFLNKVVVITGGSTGIGLATAKLFAREGAKVLIMARTEAAVQSARESIDGDVEAVTGDISKNRDLEALSAYLGRKHGRVIPFSPTPGEGHWGPSKQSPRRILIEQWPQTSKAPTSRFKNYSH